TGKQLQLPGVGWIQNARGGVAARADDVLGERRETQVCGVYEKSPGLRRGVALDGLAEELIDVGKEVVERHGARATLGVECRARPVGEENGVADRASGRALLKEHG